MVANKREKSRSKLFVQPEDGIQPILDALASAKKTIQILIFRFDRAEVERALVEAAQRGVTVQALIAFTNRGEEKNLRKLEMRLLDRGITVTRTADDLVRYHGKMFLIDGRQLYLLAFNYTHMDISLSRSFAIMTEDEELVEEAGKLFESDCKRVAYTAGSKRLVVSPVNARESLTAFIKGAKKQLLMYEMKISDPEFTRLLAQKVSEGLDVRIIGRTTPRNTGLPVRLLNQRLHARAIMRDGKCVFLGSQSLRKLEMEARREIGIILNSSKIAEKMTAVFDEDWKVSIPAQTDTMDAAIEIPAKRVAKAVAKHVQVKPVVEDVIERVLDKHTDVPFEPEEVAQTVREALRQEVHEAVATAIRDLAAPAAENNGRSERK